MDLEETTSITKPQAYSAPMVSGGWMAVGMNSKRWQSGCAQGGTRLMNSKRTSTALSLARELSHSDWVGPSVLSIHKISPAQCGLCARLKALTEIPQRHRGMRRGSSSIGRTLILKKRQRWGNLWESGQVHVGFSEHTDTTLNWTELNLNAGVTKWQSNSVHYS